MFPISAAIYLKEFTALVISYCNQEEEAAHRRLIFSRQGLRFSFHFSVNDWCSSADNTTYKEDRS